MTPDATRQRLADALAPGMWTWTRTGRRGAATFTRDELVDALVAALEPTSEEDA